MEDWKKLLGRILFGLPMAVFGIMHFINGGMMTGMVWLPGGIFWVYLTGVALIAAAISFTVNKYTLWAAWGLVLFLFLTAFTVHLPGWVGGNASSMSGFLKDASLMGAALYFTGVFSNN